MTDSKDILNKAIADLKKEQAAGPPKEIVDETLEKLAKAAAAAPHADTTSRIPAIYAGMGRRIWPAAKLAAAAAILIFVGFSIGKTARPEPLDIAHLHDALAPAIEASLEPALRRRLTEEMTQRYELALANTYVRVKEELTQQQRDDMNRLAIQMLTASNAVTNRLLADLRDTIKTEQTKDLRSVAAALQQIDRKRMEDIDVLAVDLAALAYQTDNRFRQTRGELVQLLFDTQLTDVHLPADKTVNDPNERS